MSSDSLLKDLEKVTSNPRVRNLVETRIREFKAIKSRGPEEIFKELVFCILAANFNALRSMKIVEELGDKLLTLSRSELAGELKRLGHRFPDTRADYIVRARDELEEIMNALRKLKDENELRAWLAENVRGLGYKEASHFMRNIGYENVAIIDFHILRILQRYGLVESIKTLTRKRYLEIEEILKTIASKAGISLAELDLYLWYMDSGKILK